jgi:SOS-response transcriptional repressor LexA
MSKPQPLTPIQQKYFDVIQEYCTKKGHFPTIREIQSTLGYNSPCPVQEGLRKLEIKGWIERIGPSMQPRAYRIIPQQEQRFQKEGVTCPKGLPARPGAIGYYEGGELKGIWTPAELLEEVG